MPTKTKKARSVEAVEPDELAKWIGLADPSLLGTEPIPLPASVVGRLKEYGKRVELTTDQAAAILRLSPDRVYQLCAPRAKGDNSPRLGYRQVTARAPILILAGELGAYIAATRKPRVPSVGIAIVTDGKAGRAAFDRAKAKHKL